MIDFSRRFGLTLFVTFIILLGCGKEYRPVTQTRVTEDPSKHSIPPEEALKIARSDAEKAYRDLSGYRITICLEDDGWHVDYELKDTKARGGGPHYVVDAKTGKILSKRYEQ